MASRGLGQSTKAPTRAKVDRAPPAAAWVKVPLSTKPRRARQAPLSPAVPAATERQRHQHRSTKTPSTTRPARAAVERPRSPTIRMWAGRRLLPHPGRCRHPAAQACAPRQTAPRSPATPSPRHWAARPSARASPSGSARPTACRQLPLPPAPPKPPPRRRTAARAEAGPQPAGPPLALPVRPASGCGRAQLCNRLPRPEGCPPAGVVVTRSPTRRQQGRCSQFPAAFPNSHSSSAGRRRPVPTRPLSAKHLPACHRSLAEARAPRKRLP